jgi:hypothetical protein
MQIRLDDEKQRIYGEETISYTNNSPDHLLTSPRFFRFIFIILNINVL